MDERERTRGRGPKGTLFVTATPIGNLSDITARAVEVLSTAHVIACEDTRRTGMLLKKLGIDRKGRRMVSYHDANERSRVRVLMTALHLGEDVVLVSNAGTPLVSDPGFRLVREAASDGIRVVPVPGPCAATAALCASGLPTDRFTFFGFPPVRKGAARRMAEEIAPDRGTCIFYLPARRLASFLGMIDKAHPDSFVVVAREMTKVFEEFVRGTPARCLQELSGSSLKGEVTLLVHAGNSTTRSMPAAEAKEPA